LGQFEPGELSPAFFSGKFCRIHNLPRGAINGSKPPSTGQISPGPGELESMSGDLVSLRMLLVGATPVYEERWRFGVAQASLPIEFETGSASAAKIALSRFDFDFCVLAAGLNDADKASVIQAARAKRPAPLIFASTQPGGARPDETDGVLAVPANGDDACRLVEICVRAKMPTQVLVAADSETLRGAVREILTAHRFNLSVHEASDSSDVLDRMRKSNIGLVFLDYNMPGVNGADILQGIRKESPNVAVVVMSSVLVRGASGRPHLSSALAFLKKPFYPAEVDAVLERYFGLRGPR
jgi:DNA-binding response OmpR family regulator